MHTHLQHLPPIPHPGQPPVWVEDDRIYDDTGQEYHYPQPIRAVAHNRGSHAENTLMKRLQHDLQTALYFSALGPSLLPKTYRHDGPNSCLDNCPSWTQWHAGMIDEVSTYHWNTPYTPAASNSRRRGNTSNSARWLKEATTWLRGHRRTP